ncbi:MAG: hypothetical protein MO852_06200 [Candidatus Devosia euplotis]|nr:hypothetical protein [Candidatus Devosia euplotis]
MLTGGAVTMRQPVRLLVGVEHQLDTPNLHQTLVRWTTLDHVIFTTPDLMAQECTRTTFAPIRANDKYRGQTTGMAHDGMAPLNLATAGFHDRIIAGW